MPTSDPGAPLIAASILAADFARLGEQVEEADAAGSDWIHVDVMDGHFVPNISIGLPIVAALRRVTRRPLDVHLMIEAPERYIDTFAAAGADLITVHVEASRHLYQLVQQIRAAGARPGVTLNPATPLSALEEILPYIDLVLIMSVEPGFGGQEFIPSSLNKIATLRRQLAAARLNPLISVDGGIKAGNAGIVVEASADILVVGSGIFGASGSITEAIGALRRAGAVTGERL